MPTESDSQTFTNDAFISYSRKDKEFASRLEKALEDYKPPKDLKVLQRNLVIFRDEQDITGAEYHESIKQHLNRSAKMILICSQNARGKSDNINEEIRIFAKAHGAENIFPVIISGIPNNDAKPGQEDEAAFPEALCEVQETPLATDYRGFDPKKDKVNKGIYENAWYKLLADLYNLSRSEVEQREKKRQIKKRNITIGIVSGVALALSISLVWALISRSEAIEQRQIALSRQFAAEADAEFYRRPGLALALAVRAVHIRPTYEALDHLLRFVQITSTAEYILFGHKAPVVTTIFSGDGRYLASADVEGQMIVWDVKSGKPIGPPLSGNRFIFYLDPEYIAVGPQGMIAMLTRDRLLRIWDGATGNLVHEESIKDIMPNPITSLTFASQGQRIVMSSKDGNVLWWDVQKRIPMGGPVKEHDAPVDAAAFSKDGRFFATGDRNGRVVIWDGNKAIPMLRLGPEDEKGRNLAVTSLAFSEDDRLLAWARVDNKIIVWDIKNSSMYTKPIWNMSGHQEPIVSIAFRGNGQSLLSIGLDGHFIEWALPPRRFQMNSTRMPWPQGSKYALSVDGKGVIAWGAGNMVIWGTDIRTPPLEKVNLSKPGTTEAASLSQDGQRIAFKLRDGTIVIQDVVEGKSGIRD